MQTTAAFEIECQGETAIVQPRGELGEFAFTQFEGEVSAALRRFDELTEIRNVVIDLKNTDYFGSSVLGLFVRLWKRVRARGGKMALCNISSHEEEILRMSHLDSLWPLCASRAEALSAVGETDYRSEAG